MSQQKAKLSCVTYKKQNENGSVLRLYVQSTQFKAKWSFAQLPFGSSYFVELKDLTTNCHVTTRRLEETYFANPLFEGNRFCISISLLDDCSNIIETLSIRFKSRYSKQEQRKLMKKLEEINEKEPIYGRDSELFWPIEYFHRCSTQEQWDECTNLNKIEGKVLRVGHKACRLIGNSKIGKGVWFASNLHNRGLPVYSPFGRIRWLVPAKDMFDPKKYQLFFADGYCFKEHGMHNVSLVVAKLGSQKAKLCKRRLVKLSMYKNPFLFIDKESGKIMTAKYLFVNVLHIGNFLMSRGKFDNQEVPWRGSKGGQQKILTKCKKCNINYEEDFGNQ